LITVTRVTTENEGLDMIKMQDRSCQQHENWTPLSHKFISLFCNYNLR